MTEPATHVPSSYFERLDTQHFHPTIHTGGAWNIAEQHVAPLFGLLAHAIERDHRERRPETLDICRVSFDIWGTLTIQPFAVEVTVLRAGRTIELVEARAIQDGRPAVVARAWLSARYDTAALAGTALPGIAPPDAMEPYDATTRWDGGFIQSMEVRRQPLDEARVAWWCRTATALLDGEAVSPTAHAMGLLDLANGIVPRVSPREVLFPNLDLTVHLFRAPAGEWVGFETSVSVGATGLGLTHSILHDKDGPVGSVAQILTIRPRP